MGKGHIFNQMTRLSIYPGQCLMILKMVQEKHCFKCLMVTHLHRRNKVEKKKKVEIKQGPSEPYMKFIDHLKLAIERQVLEEKAKDELVLKLNV